MKNVLVINASARKRNSKSRALTEVFIDQWMKLAKESKIKYRELSNEIIPHITENWIAASYKAKGERSMEEIDLLESSNTYISELNKADVIVLGSPMYNWSIPSSLKAYIDQVMRYGETFTVNQNNVENPYVGLLKNKILFLLLARGGDGYEVGEVNEHMNFQSNYLKTIFNVMGISNIHVIAINGASKEGEKLVKSISAANQGIRELIYNELS